MAESEEAKRCSCHYLSGHIDEDRDCPMHGLGPDPWHSTGERRWTVGLDGDHDRKWVSRREAELLLAQAEERAETEEAIAEGMADDAQAAVARAESAEATLAEVEERLRIEEEVGEGLHDDLERRTRALEELADEAARACTEPRRFHENEDSRQQKLGQAVARARAALTDRPKGESE